MVEKLIDPCSKARPGRRAVRRIFENEGYRRIAAGNAPETLSEFAVQLSARFKDTYPAAPAAAGKVRRGGNS